MTALLCSRDDRPRRILAGEADDGLNAARGIALCIALGACCWAAILFLLRALL